MAPRFIALSGGVGGAKLALGLTRLLPPDDLLIVANTGDDFDHLGLRICPDLDSVMYALAGCDNRAQGWGIEGESWNFMEALGRLAGQTWFALGDRDLATHVLRTQRLREGESLSSVTRELCKGLGVAHRIVPMTDDTVSTLVETSEGTLNFQDYFVRHRCTPRVTGFRFLAAHESSIQPDLRAALGSPRLQAVIVCPSNPFVSIGPILALPGLRNLIERSPVPVVAISPLIGGRAVKGPLAKMMMELGSPTTNEALADHYRGIVTHWVIDQGDAAECGVLRGKGLQCRSMPTLMKDDADRVGLAQALLQYCNDIAA